MLLLVVMALISSALGARLAYWQLGQADELRRQAAAQLAQPVSAEVRRGDITDRRGTLIATTAYRDRLVAYPDLLGPSARERVARRLSDLLALPADETARLVASFERRAPYVVVARRLTEAQSSNARRLMAEGELPAVELEPVAVRFYPNQGGAPRTTLASQLIGFVTEDGLGRYGIEQQQHSVLAGTAPGIASLATDGVSPLPTGADIELTVDASLQLRIEKELYAAWVADRALRVSALVMDPYTGAVLAWASVPGYDANAYSVTARRSPERFLDPIASQIYEPGSVMKMVTAAAALEAGVIELDGRVVDDRAIIFGGSRVRNADRKGMGPITFADAIAHSRNVATARVAARLGDDTTSAATALYDMWLRLGFGRRTGIDLAAEAAGIATSPQDRRWADIDLANRSFGQAVAVTPLQLAVAYSAMVNGGRLVEPHVTAAVNGAAVDVPEQQQVISAQLSEQLRRLMAHVLTSVPVLEEHTAIPGYVVGGKTGTAQFWDAASGGWATEAFNYTFCGFVGREEPDLIIVVRIHEAQPTVRTKRGSVLPEVQSFDLFRRVAQEAISVLDLPPLAPDQVPPGPIDALPTPTPPAGDGGTDPPGFVEGTDAGNGGRGLSPGGP